MLFSIVKYQKFMCQLYELFYAKTYVVYQTQ